ncbi:MAG: DUF6588 family protein [Gemmatimonadota bacterium]
MMRTTTVCGALLALLLIPADGRAQSIESELEALAQDNAQLYLHPLATGFGTALGTGFAQTARTHNRFGFDLGVRIMGAIVPDADRTFLPILPANVTYDGIDYGAPYEALGSGRTPTAAGDGSGVVLVPRGSFRGAIENAGENPDDYNVQFPEGFDIPAVPFALIQGSLGVGFGTDVIIRMIPAYEVSADVGEISAFGFGFKHSIDQWLPVLPVELAGVVGWQSFAVGEYLDANSKTLSLIASKGMGPFRAFASGGFASSSLDVSYTVSNPEANPGLPADGTTYGFTYRSTSSTRGSVGVGMKLLLLDVSAEYALGAYNTASVKVGFSFN